MNQSVIEALSETYTVDELTAQRRELLELLREGKRVLSASTGGGTSYTAEKLMDLEEQLSCVQQAITQKRAGSSCGDGVSLVRWTGLSQF
ncbi:MAG: hypothetical protein RR506_08000 [Akkermansia sp.]